ncbi:MAG TPA: AAA family ATPase [Pirellulales bacterium]|jgi:type II secretory pathway predicted ATPase ExeA|nr:AAA family ATPase [Pirellulales bacterium]
MNASAPSPTYRAHWGLRETPFRGGLDPRFFFESPTHEEALARLHFLVEERQRLGLLIGESGTGKSMLLEVFARHLRRGGSQVANVSLLGADLREFLWLIAAELGLNPDGRDDAFRLWRGVLDRLTENRYQHLETIILLDDAHDGSREVLEHVARLAEADRGAHSRLTVVLALATGRAAALETRLLELAELRIDVEPWEEPDTLGYLSWSLAQAGRKTSAFSEEAMIRLHALSEGIPRRVNQLASLALVAGAARQTPLIDAETVESIHHELGVIDAAA